MPETEDKKGYTREEAGMDPAEWFAGVEELAVFEGDDPNETAEGGAFWT